MFARHIYIHLDIPICVNALPDVNFLKGTITEDILFSSRTLHAQLDIRNAESSHKVVFFKSANDSQLLHLICKLRSCHGPRSSFANIYFEGRIPFDDFRLN
jgi:hypothetical protein